jgi:hypothetical protein
MLMYRWSTASSTYGEGFGVTEKQGDWSLMKAHIKDVMANGNISHYTYILYWMAWTVQNPPTVPR